LQVIDFVPKSHPIRQWADTFPWAALISAIEQSFDKRFPKTSQRGRRPVPIRVLFALEWLKHALGASDEDICHRLRTDFAVMYACGLRDYQVNPSQAHFVLPETLCEFRSRIDEALMDELIAIQAAAAMEEGLVSPAHLVIDTFPSEQGSQRVTDATTLYTAQKKRESASITSPSSAAAGAPSCKAKPHVSSRSSQRSCVPSAAAVEATGESS
jgi:IS5 family transposase